MMNGGNLTFANQLTSSSSNLTPSYPLSSLNSVAPIPDKRHKTNPALGDFEKAALPWLHQPFAVTKKTSA